MAKSLKEGLELIKDFLQEVIPMIVLVVLVVVVAIAISVGLLSIVNCKPTKTIYEIQFNEQQLEHVITVLKQGVNYNEQ